MSSIKLPAGFKAISGLGEAWKPQKTGESLQGILRNVRTVKVPKKGNRPAREVPIYTIQTAHGDTDVWHSAGLRALASVKKGQRVHLIYLGKRKIPGQVNPMRDFMVGVK